MNRKQLINIVKSIKDIRNNATDEQALSAVYIYPEWNAEKEYVVGDRVRYIDKLYKCNIAHTSQDDWRPDNPSALWSEVSADEYPEWKQPKGAHDAYNIGDKCSYKGKHYICTINSNVYAPDVYGWELVA